MYFENLTWDDMIRYRQSCEYIESLGGACVSMGTSIDVQFPDVRQMASFTDPQEFARFVDGMQYYAENEKMLRAPAAESVKVVRKPVQEILPQQDSVEPVERPMKLLDIDFSKSPMQMPAGYKAHVSYGALKGKYQGVSPLGYECDVLLREYFFMGRPGERLAVAAKDELVRTIPKVGEISMYEVHCYTPNITTMCGNSPHYTLSAEHIDQYACVVSAWSSRKDGPVEVLLTTDVIQISSRDIR